MPASPAESTVLTVRQNAVGVEYGLPDWTVSSPSGASTEPTIP